MVGPGPAGGYTDMKLLVGVLLALGVLLLFYLPDSMFEAADEWLNDLIWSLR